MESRRVVDDLTRRLTEPRDGGGAIPPGLAIALNGVEIRAYDQIRRYAATSVDPGVRAAMAPMVELMMDQIRDLIRARGL